MASEANAGSGPKNTE
ncbi:hypothetical protein A2U01_0096209, partial [Trifolium medium]|nr:hypothetical protein [Trifolium medium]